MLFVETRLQGAANLYNCSKPGHNRLLETSEASDSTIRSSLSGSYKVTIFNPSSKAQQFPNP